MRTKCQEICILSLFTLFNEDITLKLINAELVLCCKKIALLHVTDCKFFNNKEVVTFHFSPGIPTDYDLAAILNVEFCIQDGRKVNCSRLLIKLVFKVQHWVHSVHLPNERESERERDDTVWIGEAQSPLVT